MQFDRHTVILLRLRPDAPTMTEEEADELQDRHLAFRSSLFASGLVVAGGPLVDQDDDSLRGFSIWSCDPKVAREHAERDPAVVAGRLSVCVMTWLTMAGNLQFNAVRSPNSLAEVRHDE